MSKGLYSYPFWTQMTLSVVKIYLTELQRHILISNVLFQAIDPLLHLIFRIVSNNRHQENVVRHVIVVQLLQNAVRRLKLVHFCPVRSRISLLLIKNAAQSASIASIRLFIPSWPQITSMDQKMIFMILVG